MRRRLFARPCANLSPTASSSHNLLVEVELLLEIVEEARGLLMNNVTNMVRTQLRSEALRGIFARMARCPSSVSTYSANTAINDDSGILMIVSAGLKRCP